MSPGVYKNLPMADYLAIPAVSSGVLETLLTRCPRAAWFESWLNENKPADDTEEKDIGTIAHSMLLEGGPGAVTVIDPRDYPTKSSGNIPDGWTNNAIKAARDEARAAGRIPVLKPKWAPIEDMHNTVLAYISLLQDGYTREMFNEGGGDSELTLVWEDGDILCKARCDRINTARSCIINYKTTKGSVEPDAFARNQLLDYYVGGAFYIRGAYACFGVEPEHWYLCQETVEPYLCSLIGLDPQWKDLGNQRVKRGLRQWQACMATGRFPGYPTRPAYPTLPPWEEMREVERQTVEGIDYGSQA